MTIAMPREAFVLSSIITWAALAVSSGRPQRLSERPVVNLGSCVHSATRLRNDNRETFALTDAPVTLLLPPRTGEELQLNIEWQSWIGRSTRAWFDVSRDSTGARFFTTQEAPRTYVDSATCVATIAERPMLITTFRDVSGGNRSFNTVASWPLESGSWLRIGAKSQDSASRREFIEALYTLELDQSRGKSAYHPARPCPPGEHYNVSAPSWPLEPTPAVVSLGRVIENGGDALRGHAFVSIDGMMFMYRVMGSPGWQLPAPNDSAAIWCRENIAGRTAEIRIRPIFKKLPDRYLAEMYVMIDRHSLLHVAAASTTDDRSMPGRFLSIVRSMKLLRRSE